MIPIPLDTYIEGLNRAKESYSSEDSGYGLLLSTSGKEKIVSEFEIETIWYAVGGLDGQMPLFEKDDQLQKESELWFYFNHSLFESQKPVGFLVDGKIHYLNANKIFHEKVIDFYLNY